jgi:hypothetical protein
MFYRAIFSIILLTALATPVGLYAQSKSDATYDEEGDEMIQTGGFAKPYEYERQAYGYDPEGVEYHENQPEDFQIIFITSLPFTALASFCLTGLTSLALNHSFSVGGNYFIPFVAATALGSTTIACVSVLTNKYPPPGSDTYSQNSQTELALSMSYTLGNASPALRPVAFNLPLITAKF